MLLNGNHRGPFRPWGTHLHWKLERAQMCFGGEGEGTLSSDVNESNRFFSVRAPTMKILKIIHFENWVLLWRLKKCRLHAEDPFNIRKEYYCSTKNLIGWVGGRHQAWWTILDPFGVTNNNYRWWVLMEAIRNLT